MRKGLTTLLVILLAVGAMLVSCKAEVAAPADELVSVSFEESASRALSATLEEFKVADYFWYYAAKKTDSTGLISGETTSYDAAGAVAISSGAEAKGLSGYTVPGFSQGTWKFTLYAYATRPTSETKAAWVYSGEATGVVLQKGVTNKVTVTVSPNPEGKGILFVDMAHIYLSEASKDSHNKVSPVVSVVKHPSGTPVTDPPTGNLEYELPTGTYKVTVSYTDGYITYATGYVIATVYPGLTTTVTGYVDELVTYAEFDAKQNPDIVRETWGSNDITTSTATTVDLRANKSGDSKTEKVSSATMSADTAVKKLKELADNVGADSYSSSSLKLNLSVDTTDVKETSVTYDIGMEAILTYTKNTTQSTAKSDVKNVDDYVLVDINLTSDITAVSVTHSGETMILTDNMDKAGKAGETDPKYVDVNKGTEADPLWVGFYKLETTSNGQVLHIKTKSFSPFEVKYTMTDYVAVVDGVKYTSVSAAINAATDGTTVILLKDTSGAFTLNGNKTVTLDLAGHSYNGGNMWVIGDSTLKVDGRQSGSSVNGCFCIGYATNNNGNIEIDGGSYTCGENATVLHINGTCLNSNVTIRNATITSPSDNGIQLNGSGKFLIENTTITGDTAIYVKSGTLTIEGGTFTGDKTPADYSYNGNGANATGDAIVIDACEYPGGNPTVIIKDGTFTGTKAAIGYYQYDANNDGIKGEATIRVTGGKYNTDPSAFVPAGYSVYMDGSYYKVVNVEETFAKLAKERNLTITGKVFAETFNPDEHTLSKKGMLCVECVSNDENDVADYLLYIDGKLYLYGLEGYTGKSYTVTGVDGIRWWGNSTIETLIIDCDLEQAYKQFDGNTTIKNISFTENVTTIPAHMFKKLHSFTSITIPASITSIEYQAFRQCDGLETFIVESGLTAINLKDECLRDCKALTTINIDRPAVIGNFVGRTCVELKDVFLRNEDTTFEGSQFFTHADSGDDAGITVYVPSESVKTRLLTAAGSNLKKWTIIVSTKCSTEDELRAAIADQSVDYITLTNDITIAGNYITLTRAVTIDGQGHSLVVKDTVNTSNAQSYAAIALLHKDATIKNCVIDGRGRASGKDLIYIGHTNNGTNGGILDGCTVLWDYGTSSGYSRIIVEGVTDWAIKNCTIDGVFCVYVNSPAKGTITNNTFNKCERLLLEGASEVTVTGNTFSNVDFGISVDNTTTYYPETVSSNNNNCVVTYGKDYAQRYPESN